jgi:hypothetical protein
MSAMRCLCLAWLFAASALGAVAQEGGRDLIWGVNGHPLLSYPGVTIDQQLDYVKALGMRSYRVDVSGAKYGPGLAKLVAEARARGIEILPVITPALSLGKETAEELYKKAYELAVLLVSPLKDDIRVWELGNEMENYAIIRACEMQDNGVQYNCAWGPAGGVGPLEYYGPRWAKVSAVLKGLSDGTTAVDPTIRKAMGTAGWGHTGAFTLMQRDGIQWDISVWHMYGQDPEWAFKILAGFNRPIWVTEFNHPRGGQRDVLEQRDGLVRAMTRLRQLQRVYKVEAAHVYELLDETYWAPSSEAFMGLVELDKGGQGGWRPGAQKPAFAAVQQLIAHPGSWMAVTSDCHLNAHNRLSSAPAMQVSYIYCLALGRRIDGSGFTEWKAVLEKGASPAQVLRKVMGSSEFRAHHAVSGLGDSAFVGLLHRLLLGHEPDEPIRATYLSKLEQGSMSGADVADAIIDSNEFRVKHPLLFPTAGAAKSTPPASTPAAGSPQDRAN